MSVNIHFCGRKRSVFKERTDTDSVNSLGNLFFLFRTYRACDYNRFRGPDDYRHSDNNASMCRVSHHH